MHWHFDLKTTGFELYFGVSSFNIKVELANNLTTKLTSFKPKPSFFHTSHPPPTSSCNPPLQILSDHPNPTISLFLQKGFSEITTLTTGKALHAFCIRHSFHFSSFHFNTLINMYSKLGNIEPSRHLFDQMSHRTESTWSTMISGYVHAALYSKAIQLFSEMWVQGILPSGFMIASLLTAFARGGGMVLQGYQVHGLVVKSGFSSDVFVVLCLRKPRFTLRKPLAFAS